MKKLKVSVLFSLRVNAVLSFCQLNSFRAATSELSCSIDYTFHLKPRNHLAAEKNVQPSVFWFCMHRTKKAIFFLLKRNNRNFLCGLSLRKVFWNLGFVVFIGFSPPPKYTHSNTVWKMVTNSGQSLVMVARRVFPVVKQPYLWRIEEYMAKFSYGSK